MTAKLADGDRQDCAKRADKLKLKIKNFYDEENFNAVDLKNYDIILGLPWLTKHNPRATWAKRCATARCSSGYETLWPEDMIKRKDEFAGKYMKRDDDEAREMRAISALQMKRRAREKRAAFALLIRPRDDDDEALSLKAQPDRSKIEHSAREYSDALPDDLPSESPPDRPANRRAELIPGAIPASRGLCKMSCKELDLLSERLRDLIEKGYIKPSKSPRGSPALIALSGGKFRSRIDCRALNQSAIKSKYPSPRIDEMLDRLNGAKLFSRIDLASGFHQTRIHKKKMLKKRS